MSACGFIPNVSPFAPGDGSGSGRSLDQFQGHVVHLVLEAAGKQVLTDRTAYLIAIRSGFVAGHADLVGTLLRFPATGRSAC